MDITFSAQKHTVEVLMVPGDVLVVYLEEKWVKWGNGGKWGEMGEHGENWLCKQSPASMHGVGRYPESLLSTSPISMEIFLSFSSWFST